jgi:hypothetical protein
MEEKARTADFVAPKEVKRNRTLPNDETLSPMLRGAASAIAKMLLCLFGGRL